METRISHLQEQFADVTGHFVVISGPSAGAGKGRVIDEMLGFPDSKIWKSVSMTTRQPRPGEVLHHKYTFVTAEEFDAKEKAGGFLEANGLTEGARYGTPLAPILEHMQAGDTVLTELEVNGAQFAHQVLPNELYIFIKPTPGDLDDDITELRCRLKIRGTNDDASIERRLKQAAGEISKARELGFYTWVVNETGKSEAAAHEVYNLIAARQQDRA